jgi:hypothetical protein
MEREAKLIAVLSIFFLIFIPVSGQPAPPEIEWSKHFGGISFERGHSVQQTSDCGYIIVGTADSRWGGDDIYLLKTDLKGEEQWNKYFGGTRSEAGYSVQQTDDGGYILVGTTHFKGSGDIYLIKTNSDGKEEWYKIFQRESASESGYSVQQTKDGGYIVVGEAYYSHFEDKPNVNIYIIKTDRNGNEEWARDITHGLFAFGRSVQQTKDGGYIVVGATVVADSGVAMLLVKLNGSGTEQWRKIIDTAYYDWGRSVQQTYDGGYIIAGSSDVQAYLIKTDQDGDEEWSEKFGEEDAAVSGCSVQQTTDRGYILIGYRTRGEKADIYVVKTDERGEQEWIMPFDVGSEYAKGYSVQQTTDGGYILAGVATFPSKSEDIYLIKLKQPGAAGIQLVGPGNEVAFSKGPKPPPLEFVWNSIGYEKFQIQFSADRTFSERQTVTAPDPENPKLWMSKTSYQPDQAIAKEILSMAGSYGIIYWRILGSTAADETGFSETRSFRIR